MPMRERASVCREPFPGRLSTNATSSTDVVPGSALFTRGLHSPFVANGPCPPDLRRQPKIAQQTDVSTGDPGPPRSSQALDEADRRILSRAHLGMPLPSEVAFDGGLLCIRG